MTVGTLMQRESANICSVSDVTILTKRSHAPHRRQRYLQKRAEYPRPRGNGEGPPRPLPLIVPQRGRHRAGLRSAAVCWDCVSEAPCQDDAVLRAMTLCNFTVYMENTIVQLIAVAATASPAVTGTDRKQRGGLARLHKPHVLGPLQLAAEQQVCRTPHSSGRTLRGAPPKCAPQAQCSRLARGLASSGAPRRRRGSSSRRRVLSRAASTCARGACMSHAPLWARAHAGGLAHSCPSCRW